ncbi:MAG: hypothetical protein ACYDC3_01770 [Candidatus Binataceae bacterium]
MLHWGISVKRAEPHIERNNQRDVASSATSGPQNAKALRWKIMGHYLAWPACRDLDFAGFMRKLAIAKPNQNGKCGQEIEAGNKLWQKNDENLSSAAKKFL